MPSLIQNLNKNIGICIYLDNCESPSPATYPSHLLAKTCLINFSDNKISKNFKIISELCCIQVLSRFPYPAIKHRCVFVTKSGTQIEMAELEMDQNSVLQPSITSNQPIQYGCIFENPIRTPER